MPPAYVELHTHSFYSFGEGASHLDELLVRAKELGYPALALTDTNLCGALEFARTAGNLGIQPITGGEITLSDGSHLTLLAKSRQGYANLSRLMTLANQQDRREPMLDPGHLQYHSEGLVLLTGCRKGRLPALVEQGRCEEARAVLRHYLDVFGRDSVHVELNQNLTFGDTRRNRQLVMLAREVGAPLVATNNVHYHIPERHRLQNALVAIKHNTTLDRALPYLKLSSHFYLKSAADMQRMFRSYPGAIANSLRITENCAFNLSSDLGYQLPTPPVPQGYTPDSYLRRLCYEAALRGGATQVRRYQPEGGGKARRGVQAHRKAPAIRLSAAVPGDSPHRPQDNDR